MLIPLYFAIMCMLSYNLLTRHCLIKVDHRQAGQEKFEEFSFYDLRNAIEHDIYVFSNPILCFIF